jgi:hypothetical protein
LILQIAIVEKGQRRLPFFIIPIQVKILTRSTLHKTLHGLGLILPGFSRNNSLTTAATVEA